MKDGQIILDSLRFHGTASYQHGWTMTILLHKLTRPFDSDWPTG